MKQEKQTVAFCGTRGIPARYGGFETAVDEISRRFVQWGVNVEVFCRESSCAQPGTAEPYGRQLNYVKGSRNRKLDTFVSSLQTGWKLLKNRNKYACVFWFNNANFPGILLTLLANIPLFVNTDGLEWRRKKWQWPFKLYYFLTTVFITRLCASLISDSIAIKNYYRKTFQRETIFIPYGTPETVHVHVSLQHRLLEKLKVKSEKYFLQITRCEPDNRPLENIQGFIDSGLAELGYQFVLVGWKENSAYSREVGQLAHQKGIVILPPIYDPVELQTLRENCFSYVHGNSVGGTNPALLEAMVVCPRIMAIENEFSHEVLGNLGLFYTDDNLADMYSVATTCPDIHYLLYNNVTSRYQWDAVAGSYLRLALGQDSSYCPSEQTGLSVELPIPIHLAAQSSTETTLNVSTF